MSTQPEIVVAAADSPHWKTLVNIDGSGILKGIGVVHADQDRQLVQIELDNMRLANNKISSSYKEVGNIGLTLDIPFSDKLKIKGKNQFNNSQKPRYWISLVLDR
jgi:hypothetical protein